MTLITVLTLRKYCFRFLFTMTKLMVYSLFLFLLFLVLNSIGENPYVLFPITTKLKRKDHRNVHKKTLKPWIKVTFTFGTLILGFSKWSEKVIKTHYRWCKTRFTIVQKFYKILLISRKLHDLIWFFRSSKISVYFSISFSIILSVIEPEKWLTTWHVTWFATFFMQNV